MFPLRFAGLPFGVIIPVCPPAISGVVLGSTPSGSQDRHRGQRDDRGGLAPGVEITGYERHQDGHGFEVRWPLPERPAAASGAGAEIATSSSRRHPSGPGPRRLGAAPASGSTGPLPSLCASTSASTSSLRSSVRTRPTPSASSNSCFGRPDRQHAEDVARRLGISAETVEQIVEYQLAEERRIDPSRVITDVGLDGRLSLKKRHRLYVTLLTDLSDPAPAAEFFVAVAAAAAQKCLDLLSEEQRQQVRTHRVDMGSAFPAACATRLKHSRAVTDRFHVAKKFNEVVDALRKN